MLEVTFSDSVAGALKFAVGMKKGDILHEGAVSVICDDPVEKERILKEMSQPKVWNGGEIPGSAKDVVSLHLQLDFGDISSLEADPRSRRKPLETLFSHYEGVAGELIHTAENSLSRILSADSVRLWIGEQDAADIIAAFYLCHLLRRKNVAVSAVCLPSVQQSGSEIRRFSGAAEFTPEELSLHAQNTYPVCEEMRRYMASRWCELKAENAPLRVMLNGLVTGADENVYDRILLSCVPEGEFSMGIPVGKALGKIRGVGDNILLLRMHAFLRCGILEEVTPARGENPYSAVLRRGLKWQ